MKNTKNDELAVCGFAAVKVLEKANWQRIKRLYLAEEKAPLFGGLCKSLAAAKRPYNVVREEDLARLCGSIHHQGVVAMIEPPDIPPLNMATTSEWVERGESALLMDRVGNANNLGAIIRSAAYFGLKNIIIPLDEAQSSITTSSYRVAEGGMEFVRVYSIRSIARLLDDMAGRMVRVGTALDATDSSRSLPGLCRGKPVLVALGNEERGISPEVRRNCDYVVRIPHGGRRPAVDSLNVAQAASVILYELAGCIGGAV